MSKHAGLVNAFVRWTRFTVRSRCGQRSIKETQTTTNPPPAEAWVLICVPISISTQPKQKAAARLSGSKLHGRSRGSSQALKMGLNRTTRSETQHLTRSLVWEQETAERSWQIWYLAVGWQVCHRAVAAIDWGGLYYDSPRCNEDCHVQGWAEVS